MFYPALGLGKQGSSHTRVTFGDASSDGLRRNIHCEDVIDHVHVLVALRTVNNTSSVHARLEARNEKGPTVATDDSCLSEMFKVISHYLVPPCTFSTL